MLKRRLDLNLNTVTLWAMWESTIPTTLQNFGKHCDKMFISESIVLEDKRDGEEYQVKKLKDSRCWTVQNLRLGESQQIKLSSADSDIDDEFILPISTTESWNYTEPKLYEHPTNKQRYGVYYNWYSATAGSGTSSKDEEAPHSICPKGWRLPTSEEHSLLYNKYGWPDIGGEPGIIRSGDFYSGQIQLQDAKGSYWSSTSAGSNNAYVMTFSNPSFQYKIAFGTSMGLSVHCIAEI